MEFNTEPAKNLCFFLKKKKKKVKKIKNIIKCEKRNDDAKKKDNNQIHENDYDGQSNQRESNNNIVEVEH